MVLSVAYKAGVHLLFIYYQRVYTVFEMFDFATYIWRVSVYGLMKCDVCVPLKPLNTKGTNY